MRDLNEDLAFCNETEPTAFVVGPTTNAGTSLLSKERHELYAKTSTVELAEFIAEAREGWPEAIRRAIAAEAEVFDICKKRKIEKTRVYKSIQEEVQKRDL
ncbi:hypothetical protein ACTP13_19310 [Paenibacillus peoriae]|uniref:hypothetical protein n=1 Tax=Paenibacillus peoriae TaxID=59893 RepID=UPI003F99ADFE